MEHWGDDEVSIGSRQAFGVGFVISKYVLLISIVAFQVSGSTAIAEAKLYDYGVELNRNWGVEFTAGSLPSRFEVSLLETKLSTPGQI